MGEWFVYSGFLRTSSIHWKKVYFFEFWLVFILKDPCSDVVCGLDQECITGACFCIRGEGWHRLIPAGETECADKDECMDDFICEAGETCVNNPGSYSQW